MPNVNTSNFAKAAQMSTHSCTKIQTMLRDLDTNESSVLVELKDPVTDNTIAFSYTGPLDELKIVCDVNNVTINGNIFEA